MPHLLPYAASKGALEVFTRHLAQRLGPRGIAVNAVAPGMVENARTRRDMQHSPGLAEYMAGVSALGRLGTVEDIAGAVAFLAAGDSRWITGQVIDATGGSHL